MFVPSQSSHIGRFKPLMQALTDRGHRVRVLCVDAVVPSTNRIRPMLDGFGFPVETFGVAGYDADRHWFWRALDNKKLLRAAREFLVRGDADILFLGSTGSDGTRALLHAARALGIRTVLLHDGVVLPAIPGHLSFLAKTRVRIAGMISNRLRLKGAFEGAADRLLIVNRWGREELARRGLDPATIRVVGSPEFDQIAEALQGSDGGESEVDLRRRLGIPERRPVVLYAHQSVFEWDETAELIRTMLEATREVNAYLMVKLHPRAEFTPEPWRDWARRQGMGEDEVGFFQHECRAIEALQVAAACVTAFSTVSIEALMVGRPLVLIRYKALWYYIPYGERYGAALDANSPEQLQSCIRSVVVDDDVRKRLLRGAEQAVRDELGGVAGQSVERIVGELEELLREAADPRLGGSCGRSRSGPARPVKDPEAGSP